MSVAPSQKSVGTGAAATASVKSTVLCSRPPRLHAHAHIKVRDAIVGWLRAHSRHAMGPMRMGLVGHTMIERHTTEKIAAVGKTQSTVSKSLTFGAARTVRRVQVNPLFCAA